MTKVKTCNIDGIYTVNLEVNENKGRVTVGEMGIKVNEKELLKKKPFVIEIKNSKPRVKNLILGTRKKPKHYDFDLI